MLPLMQNIEDLHQNRCCLVGVAGFEPTTPTPPVWCATRLRYTPIQRVWSTGSWVSWARPQAY